ncbi:quercetin dioxygenase-like cupin family protein [Haloferula luteola]|uniref:Quercetin dioxygenase-like cupin family protein n=1 Tax=Haloferula luteola TaxID=595692 RepID=A0A840VG82_9BACT|nr:cupin domain-containing protein [Haloferula luteola]MBB5352840.1 quercetin dioxygenase-like cupin family protein [Haloferula luteola]
MNPTQNPMESFSGIHHASEMPEMEAFGDRARFCLTGVQTEGRYTAFYLETPPGGGPPPHVHDREDEWFHVLEGRAEFFFHGEWKLAVAGDSVFAPRGALHAFRNVGDTVLRQLIHTAPSGFEHFFSEMADLWKRDGGPVWDEIVVSSAKYGIHYPDPEGDSVPSS